MKQEKIVIIGGGAAGFFAAANMVQQAPDKSYTILEQGPQVLGKVKISGGGRCNVTHACFEPKELSRAYARGEKALLGPFHHFMTGDVMGWFEERGVTLKIEEDGRVFPESDQSQTIIDCLLHETRDRGVKVLTNTKVREIQAGQNHAWVIQTNREPVEADKILISTGSNKAMWRVLENLGHSIIPPVPSLFTFEINDPRIEGLAGISMQEVDVSIPKTRLSEQGPILITHWGLSGPSILRLSAWGARILNEKNYHFPVEVNWTGHRSIQDIEEIFNQKRQKEGKKQILNHPLFGIPSRLWKSLILNIGIHETQKWAELTRVQSEALSIDLGKCSFQVKGKSTYKDEFVTAGGVHLKEVHFKTMESKILPGIFLAGEVLNIDAITGGYNFQAAWTGAWIAANAIVQEPQ